MRGALLSLVLLLHNPRLEAQQTLYFNAKIFTANPQRPYADALLIAADTIKAVGTLSEIAKEADGAAMRVDCKGQFVMPGLADAHIHAISGGLSLNKPNLFEQEQPAHELHAYALSQLPNKNAFTRDVLVLYGVNISTWQHITALETIFNAGPFANTALVLQGSDGHTSWANHAMLKKAGIDAAWHARQTEELQSLVPLNASGVPSGFLKEEAFQLLAPLLASDAEARVEAAKAAQAHLHSLGITAILEARGAILKDDNYNYLEAYHSLHQQNGLQLHVALLAKAEADSNAAQQVIKLKQLAKQYATRNLQLIGFKIYADGVVEHPTHTAALSQAYTGLSHRGRLLFQPRGFARFATVADSAGLLVHVHAIGDRAVTETLNGFDLMRKANGNTGINHTITHLQFVLERDIPRFKEIHVLPNMQLLWAFGDVTTVDMVKPYVPAEVYGWQYPARSLLQAGATITGASDWPVSSANVFEAIYRAETRRGPLGVLDSSQCMPRYEMLLAYTLYAAKALRMENRIGSLQKGKSADFILLDRDVLTVSPEALAETKVLLTFFEGKEVYRRL